MMKVALAAMVAAVCAVGSAQMLAKLGGPAMPDARPQAAVAIADPDSAPDAASVSKSADGHFWADADVNGQDVRFLIDTGASAVALTAADAQRLGIDTSALKYTYSVATANGQAHAAPVTLASISIDGVRVSDVQAIVMDGGLETSLLGMSYLGRLSKLEVTPNSMFLRP